MFKEASWIQTVLNLLSLKGPKILKIKSFFMSNIYAMRNGSKRASFSPLMEENRDSKIMGKIFIYVMPVEFIVVANRCVGPIESK
ncbi:hypothetical protein ACJIZ3_022423 [Penstemon smallii]|uniref:Uncharacterized protein n=1 Tax=Penstemon smallii TaxID=265156 RepID=A0ABD3TNA2_9LAMI